MPPSAGPRPGPCWSNSWFDQFGGLYLNAGSGRGRPCCRLGMFIGGSGGLCSFRRGHLASTKVWPVHIGGPPEIARAACRERVGTNVSIAVGTVPLKKKKKE